MSKKLVGILLCMVMVVMSMSAAFAESVDVPFFDDFSGNAAKWDAYMGEWNIENGVYHQAEKTNWLNGSVIKDAKYTDFEIELKIKLGKGEGDAEGWAGASLRKANPSDNLAQSGVLCYMNRSAVALYTPNRKEFASAKIETNSDYNTLKIVCKGSNIKVYVNGSAEPAIDTEDKDFSEGYVSLAAGATEVWFDDVKVTPLKAADNKAAEADSAQSDAGQATEQQENPKTADMSVVPFIASAVISGIALVSKRRKI